MAHVLSFLFAAFTHFTAPVLAQEPGVVLAYEAPVACPDEGAFRDLVAGRLGRDPFARAEGGGGTLVSVRLAARGSRFGGVVEATTTNGDPPLRRDLDPEPDCREVARALALAVSLMLDPLGAPAAEPRSLEEDPDTRSGVRQDSQAPPEVESPSVDSAIESPNVGSSSVGSPSVGSSSVGSSSVGPSRVSAPAAASGSHADPAGATGPADSGRLGFAVELALRGTYGLTPGASVGPLLAIALRAGSWTVGALGQVDLMPTDVSAEDGDRIEANVFAAGPFACFHHDLATACLQVPFGVFQGRGLTVGDPVFVTSFFASVELRGGVSLPLLDFLDLQALLGAIVPMVRTSLAIEGRTQWTAPPVAASLSVGLVAAFM